MAGYWPPLSRPVSHFLRHDGASESRIKVWERYYGFSEIRLASEVGTTEQLLAAVSGLTTVRGSERRVEHLLHARTMPAATPYPVSTVHELRHLLGLNHAAAFCVSSQACASGLLAVDLAGRLLAAGDDPDALALVITGEKVFTPGGRVIPDVGVMGECTAALLIGLDGPHDRVLSYACRTQGEFEASLSVSRTLTDDIRRNYPTALAAVISEAVDKAGLTMAEIDLILPHNVNRMSWAPIFRALGIRNGTERIFWDNLALIGHCFGADAFLNYLAAVERGRLQRGMRYLMTAVGDGDTFAAMLLQH
ncbi:3-oxoacyl-[acyl-carrier-protein] synthase III C-terminal domain-containing protein [Nocardia asteroides]|uniref:3-oxoacyl-[acyl-carrier-protein] synthase III C-terminal domain-containing protein n=1 Tax=Nocardia asteroides TaxID=1824 RepID=UPI001E2C39D7|nr:3-oxoacyl-[acyl-carrier-protein] synthase III C-terminal domain-containing protein [Nocardia asteroides]UGT61033.1 hypothetical protein LTT61_28480 [Nocardia asteroides]